MLDSPRFWGPIVRERIQSSNPRSWTPLLPLEISVVSNLCESVCNIDREGGREGGDWRKLGNDRLKGVFAVVELDPGVEF